MRRGSRVRSWSRVATVGDAAYRCSMMSRSLVAQPEGVGAKPDKPKTITRDELSKVITTLVNEAEPRRLREFAKVLTDRMQVKGEDVKDLRVLQDGRFLLNPTIIDTDGMKKIVKDVLGFYFKSDQEKILSNAWKHLGLQDMYAERPKAVGWGKFSVVERGVGERKYRTEERERTKTEKKKAPVDQLVDRLKALATRYGQQSEREALETAVNNAIAQTEADKLADDVTRAQQARLIEIVNEVTANAVKSEKDTYYALLVAGVLAKVFVDNKRFQELSDILLSNLEKKMRKDPEFLSLENMPEDLVEALSKKEASDDQVLLNVVHERPWRRRA